MRKSLFYLVSAIVLAGCTEELELPSPAEDAPTQTMHTRSLEGAVYHEVTDSWMIPQKNPYTLANVQRAYDRLSSGQSAQMLSRTQASAFPDKQLKATHYALKIYPRTEAEQWEIELMEDVLVDYVPFGYTSLTQKEIAKLPQARSTAAVFQEKSPYTVTYEGYQSTEGGPTEPFTSQLPILYALWPVDKPLPDRMEYVIDHEIFRPQADDSDAMRMLKNEVMALASGVPATALAPTSSDNPYLPSYSHMYIRSHSSYRKESCAVGQLLCRIRFGRPHWWLGNRV